MTSHDVKVMVYFVYMKLEQSKQIEIFRKPRDISFIDFQDTLNTFLKKLSVINALVIDINSEVVEGLLTIIILYERKNRDIDGKRIKRT